MDTLDVRGLVVKDESRYDKFSNGTVKERVYRFYLGPSHGPFEERVPLDGFDPNEFQRRVTLLRSHLQAQK